MNSMTLAAPAWNRDKVQSVAERFNSRAAKDGWESHCDPSLTFVRPQLNELLALWTDRAQGGVPSRSAFDARSLKSVLSNMLIAERVQSGGERRWRFRYFGSELVKFLGEYTNRDLHETLPAEHAERWSFSYDCVTEGPAPARIVSAYQFAKIDYLDREGLFLPIANEQGEVALVLTATYVRRKVYKD